MNEKAKYSIFRDDAVTNAATSVSTSPCTVFGYKIKNRDVVDIYVKFYEISAAGVTVGTSEVKDTVYVRAGEEVCERGEGRGEDYSVLSVAAVKESADAGTTAPDTLPIIKIFYD